VCEDRLSRNRGERVLQRLVHLLGVRRFRRASVDIQFTKQELLGAVLVHDLVSDWLVEAYKFKLVSRRRRETDARLLARRTGVRNKHLQLLTEARKMVVGQLIECHEQRLHAERNHIPTSRILLLRGQDRKDIPEIPHTNGTVA